MSQAAAYQPGDLLFLWWLADPAAPRLIGELRMARKLQGVSLAYAPAWLESGFPLSEDLPLQAGEFLPPDQETAAGAVDDARPDRWGERVIKFLDKPPRSSVLDFLYFAGHGRFGALGVPPGPTVTKRPARGRCRRWATCWRSNGWSARCWPASRWKKPSAA